MFQSEFLSLFQSGFLLVPLEFRRSSDGCSWSLPGYSLQTGGSVGVWSERAGITPALTIGLIHFSGKKAEAVMLPVAANTNLNTLRREIIFPIHRSLHQIIVFFSISKSKPLICNFNQYLEKKESLYKRS